MCSEIDPAAVKNMTKKRSVGSSSALAEATPKQPCAATDTDSFEEFFALLQRIEATKRHCSRSYGGDWKESAAKYRQEGMIDDAKAVTSQALWRPSFEWHDFLPRGSKAHDVDWKGGGRDLKEREPVSAEASQRLDLNLPLEQMPL